MRKYVRSFIHRKSLLPVRDGIVIHEGKINSLRRFKDDVKEVAAGFECGISIDSYRDVKEGDQLEAFELKEEAAELK